MEDMFTKRVRVSVLTGAVLGVFCIIGALVRSGAAAPYLFALWFNRVLMGMVIGLFHEKASARAMVLRGALAGLVVSFAFYSAAGYADAVSFLAGVPYGVIIEAVARRFGGEKPSGG